ncbi:winged helix-turn-helix domain-containing protein [Phenylobacterium sp.]|uniref:winged helix-turn-helix domain-containing protein n=1 Tax=Phenylobacterium sp. TaxID=1871053 RepID=UPI0035673DC8
MELGRNAKGARPSEVMQSQQDVIRQQDELIEVLKGALAAAGMATVPAHARWMSALSPQERALFGVLYARYPRPVPREVILEFLPGHDHVRERQLQVVDVLVHKLRKKLGVDAVVTERGAGFRFGATFYEQTPKTRVEPSPGAAVAPERASFEDKRPGLPLAKATSVS